MDTIHTDHLPVETLEQCRGDARQMKVAFIETKFCDLEDGQRLRWITELKLFRKNGIEKLWFDGRNEDAPLFWVGKIPATTAA